MIIKKQYHVETWFSPKNHKKEYVDDHYKCIWFTDSIKTGRVVYRKYGPAKIDKNGYMRWYERMYGYSCRKNGPSIHSNSGSKIWSIENKQFCTEEQYWNS